MIQQIATRPADPQATLAHISLGVRMNLGTREFLAIEDGGLRFRIGRGGTYGRYAVIRLAADDTYRVDIIRLKRGTLELLTDAYAEGVYAENLGETLIRLHDEATSR